MVIFDLICDQGHQFEGWFKNSDELDVQTEQGLLECPYCESLAVTKKLAAPKVTRKSNSLTVNAPSIKNDQEVVRLNQESPESYLKLQEMLNKVHKYVDDNFVDVGNKFADEALSMHRGEKEQSNIKGTATVEQVQEMAEEGVEAVPLPPRPIDPKKLN